MKMTVNSMKCISWSRLAIFTAAMTVLSSYGAQNETYIEGWEKKTSNLLIYKRLCNV